MTCYRFASRSPMAYRRVLRTVPKSLRRSWWRQRYLYDEPRTPISRLYGANIG